MFWEFLSKLYFTTYMRERKKSLPDQLYGQWSEFGLDDHKTDSINLSS